MVRKQSPDARPVGPKVLNVRAKSKQLLFSLSAVSYSRNRKLTFSPQLPKRHQTLPYPKSSLTMRPGGEPNESVCFSTDTSQARDVRPGRPAPGPLSNCQAVGRGRNGRRLRSHRRATAGDRRDQGNLLVDNRLRRQFEQEA